MCSEGVLCFWGKIMQITQKLNYFTRVEKILWTMSVVCIVGAFLCFDRTNYMTLVASLVGATSLIYCAKGNPFGQVLMIAFSLLYGIISWRFAYYGEMITYVGMTGPMAVVSLIAWMRNPYNGNHAQVRVGSVGKREIAFMFVLSAVVTFVFYFILKAFGTANLAPSTLSVTTSFIAVYLTFRRSAYFALAYALNDLVLILLWSRASLENPAYISVVVCFMAFWVNDLYGYVNWRRMHIRQRNVK